MLFYSFLCCFIFFFFFFFFFSSRRRHTRCSRDWSSDVCSSDLFCNCLSSSVFSRPFLTTRRRLPLSHGFSMYWYRPTLLIALIAFFLSAYPVSSILGTSGNRCFTFDRKVRPSISGIR